MINKLDNWKEITENCDDSHATIGIANLVSSIIIALSIVFASLLISVSFIWGWIGFVSLIGLIILILTCILFANEE